MPDNYLQIIANGQRRVGGDVDQAIKRACDHCEGCGGDSENLFAYHTMVAITRALFGKSIDGPEFLVVLCPKCEDIRMKCLGVDAIG
jgi:hypothetical protein